MNPHRTQVAAVRLRNALTNLLKEIGQDHDGWNLEPPPEEMTQMSCNHGIKNDYCGKCHEMDDARDAVIEAAKVFQRDCAYPGAEQTAKEYLCAQVAALRKLEQPADPLEPVREFVRIASKHVVFTNKEFVAKLEAAEKALGMEP